MCVCVVNTHLSCRRTEALRGGVVIGGGVVGSSAGGEAECTADMLMDCVCVCVCVCVFESVLASCSSVHHAAGERGSINISVSSHLLNIKGSNRCSVTTPGVSSGSVLIRSSSVISYFKTFTQALFILSLLLNSYFNTIFILTQVLFTASWRDHDTIHPKVLNTSLLKSFSTQDFNVFSSFGVPVKDVITSFTPDISARGSVSVSSSSSSSFYSSWSVL